MEMNLKDEIKFLRFKKQITQDELAVKSGVSVATIRRIESGKATPTISTCKKLEDGLGLLRGQLLDYILKD